MCLLSLIMCGGSDDSVRQWNHSKSEATDPGAEKTAPPPCMIKEEGGGGSHVGGWDGGG